MKMSEYFSDDITWCSSECKNMQCFRNKMHIRNPSSWRSFSDYAANDCKGHIPVEEAAKHGYWFDGPDGITPFCSVCKMSHHMMVLHPAVCPNCNAIMDQEVQDGSD